MLNVVRKTLFTSLSYMGSHRRDGGTMEGIGQKQQKAVKPGKSHPARCDSLQWASGFATQDKDVIEALVLEAGHCRPGRVWALARGRSLAALERRFSSGQEAE